MNIISIPIIFLTGHGDLEMAVEAMKAGAYDFLVKPVDNERLLTTISRTIKRILVYNHIRGCVKALRLVYRRTAHAAHVIGFGQHLPAYKIDGQFL